MRISYIKAKENLQKALAEIIQFHREKQKKSISRISAEILMSKSMWRDLEKGIKDPQLTTLWRVSEALNIPINDLLLELKVKLGDDFTLID